MRRFGITFDLQDPDRPDTIEHAAAYVRTWAAFIGQQIPEDAEKLTEYLDGPEDGMAFQLRVEYRWELAA
jgi:hypothetical protein